MTAHQVLDDDKSAPFVKFGFTLEPTCVPFVHINQHGTDPADDVEKKLAEFCKRGIKFMMASRTVSPKRTQVIMRLFAKVSPKAHVQFFDLTFDTAPRPFNEYRRLSRQASMVRLMLTFAPDRFLIADFRMGRQILESFRAEVRHGPVPLDVVVDISERCAKSN